MLYVSLTRSLLDIYYPLPFKDEMTARLALNTSSLKNLWCSIYTEENVDSCIARFGGIKLPHNWAMKLDYDSHEVYKHEQAKLGLRQESPQRLDKPRP